MHRMSRPRIGDEDYTPPTTAQLPVRPSRRGLWIAVYTVLIVLLIVCPPAALILFLHLPEDL